MATSGRFVRLPLMNIAASVRRLHDRGRSGWFMLVTFNSLLAAFAPDRMGVAAAP
jgi:uncharacterized membrane protein YhaH (DUF805 family)